MATLQLKQEVAPLSERPNHINDSPGDPAAFYALSQRYDDAKHAFQYCRERPALAESPHTDFVRSEYAARKPGNFVAPPTSGDSISLDPDRTRRQVWAVTSGSIYNSTRGMPLPRIAHMPTGKSRAAEIRLVHGRSAGGGMMRHGLAGALPNCGCQSMPTRAWKRGL